jgi:hypothetical protein
MHAWPQSLVESRYGGFLEHDVLGLIMGSADFERHFQLLGMIGYGSAVPSSVVTVRATIRINRVFIPL